MTRTAAEREEPIALELARAEAARRAGNEGMARVCARRAAGMALRLRHASGGEGNRDALVLLRDVAGEEGAPEGVRRAAERLIARVRADFTPAHPHDPIEDARTIIRHCAGTGPLA
jgi:hypothetical protein